MGSKNIHNEQFDEGTLLKLEIFKKYLREWLPVFLAKDKTIWNEINIFDFFAGPGKDTAGNQGSPLMIVEELENSNYNGKTYKEYIEDKNLKIKLLFNEFLKQKYDQLKVNLASYTNSPHYTITTQNEDFKDIFERIKPEIASKQAASLLFLDQNGIKQIDQSTFQFIISQKKTDFIFYISSSYILRFAQEDAFQKYLSISKEDFEGQPYYHCHRVVLNYYKSLISPTAEYYLAPFSIKKGKNIYGIIFGTSHLFGIEKFLRVCWNIDPQRGEANFDLDGDKIDPSAPTLFAEFNRPKKIQKFQQEISEMILERRISNYKDALIFGLVNGFLPKHVNEAISNLAKDKKLQQKPKFTSSRVHKLDSSEPFHLI